MLLSMTGYGRATRTDGGKTYTAELRALNSKQSDLRLRTNLNLQAHELELRKSVLAATKRGKVEMSVDIDDEAGSGKVKVDLPLLAAISHEVYFRLNTYGSRPLPEHTMDGLVPALLRTPGIIETGAGQLAANDWENIQATVEDALQRLLAYRQQEGQVLSEDLSGSVRSILELLARVDDYSEQRIDAVRERMERHLAEYLGRANVDKNRYEQEVLFYLEKMDINEEKVRLAQNCDYFLEILENEDDVKGRKLTFISQELGREINTLGAKSYSADLQRLVVNMKEHLEMIKEQLANVA
ncbi:uncharacterized protein (TIGR00255 family) [Neolewinella xylanilytica]|uniref:Uncharacterized protein (TIGR00255 family) n=1 Tax=Neolewinella xylanilytica TaxID=1514080 RepID=A0A2S6I3R5_9BACT|nr:DUF1732 domain-containing protein [Neolewinella xylanilytica]PPK85824.1 uncharacterized protein (TIGR00255 family) [Neolewinella xylanilytica]